MTIRQIIDLARSGELKQLGIKDDTEAILGYVNLGMIELYKRFPLKVEEYLIELLDSTVIYSLPSDCMWLVAAYGEVSEHDSESVNILNINTEDDPLSVNTISWNKVQIPLSVTGSFVSLMYVASPTYLTEADLDNEIDLPVQMVDALLEYVAYKGHASQNGDASAENNVHYQRFEASCERVKQQGMFTPDDMDMRDRIKIKGFA